MPQQSARAQIVERRTYLRPTNKDGTEFETREQAWTRVISHQRWLWERAQDKPLDAVQEAELAELYELFINLKATSSGRTRWMADTEISRTIECVNFNCAATEAKNPEDIRNISWLLLNGAGVGFVPVPGELKGFDTQINLKQIHSTKVIAKNNKGENISDPTLKGAEKSVETYENGVLTIVLGDTAIAWAQFLERIVSPMPTGMHTLVFDTSPIRPAGYRLGSYGWVSSGDIKIQEATAGIVKVLNGAVGKNLTFMNILDVVNWIGTILASRRSAQIAMVPYGSEMWREFALAKKNHWEGNDHRTASNNSLMFNEKPTHAQLSEVFDLILEGGGSEPGMLNMEAMRKRAPYANATNPCITKDTWIDTENGPLQVSELSEPFVANVRGELYKSTGFWSTGMQNVVKIVTNGGHELCLTPTHKIRVDDDRQWVEAGHLVVDDVVWLNNPLKNDGTSKYDGDVSRVSYVEKMPNKEEVFDCTVDIIHAFGANGIYVHNCGEIALPAKSQDVTDAYELPKNDLRGGGVCNLVETYLSRFNGDLVGLYRAHFLAARANYRQTLVDFRDGILSEGWHYNNEQLRLCGVGVSGVAGWEFKDSKKHLQELRSSAVAGADSMADELGTNRSKLVTTIKPAGCLPLYGTVITDDGVQTMAELLENHVVGQKWCDKTFTLPIENGKTLTAKKTYDNGLDEVFAIKTVYNLPLYATAQHKWQLEDGEWKETKNLEKGDALKVESGLYTKITPYQFRTLHEARLRPHGRARLQHQGPIKQPKEMTDDLAWFIGYLLGDGCMSPNAFRFRFTDANEAHLDRAHMVIEDVFGLKTPAPKKCTDREAYTWEFGNIELWNWFHANDLNKLLCEGMPKPIRYGSSNHIIACVAGLIDSDGCYNKKQKSVIFTQSLTEFTESFQQTAWAAGLAFGRSPNTKGQNFQKNKCIYLCTLSGHSTPHAVKELWKHSSKLQGYPVITWNRAYAAKVKSVEYVGIEHTADIEVAGEHRYYAYGGVSTHNSQTKASGVVGDELGEGLHKPMARYIFNRINLGKHDPLVPALRDAGYELMENPYDSTGVIVTIPVEYGDFGFAKVVIGEDTVEVNLDTAVEQLEVYKLWQENYTDHNTSVTISYDATESKAIVDWLYENWDFYVGVSFLYRTDPTKTAADLGYKYLPQQPVSKEQYHAYADALQPVNFAGTDQEEMLDLGECATGSCPIR